MIEIQPQNLSSNSNFQDEFNRFMLDNIKGLAHIPSILESIVKQMGEISETLKSINAEKTKEVDPYTSLLSWPGIMEPRFTQIPLYVPQLPPREEEKARKMKIL